MLENKNRMFSYSKLLNITKDFVRETHWILSLKNCTIYNENVSWPYKETHTFYLSYIWGLQRSQNPQICNISVTAIMHRKIQCINGHLHLLSTNWPHLNYFFVWKLKIFLRVSMVWSGLNIYFWVVGQSVFELKTSFHRLYFKRFADLYKFYWLVLY